MNRGMGSGHGGRMMGQNQLGAGISPFVNDFGLQDIDMELELLKRKREIIEKQQLMLTNSFIQRNEYDSSYNDQSYERSYDESGYGGGSSRKRSIPVWEHDPPAKRMSESDRGTIRGSGRALSGSRAPAPSRGSGKPFGARSAASAAPRSQTFRRPNPPPKRREFNPSKVSKPGASPPPLMSLGSVAPAELRAMAKSSQQTRTRPRRAPCDDESLVLRSDVPPSRALTGRLELALGAILKDIKLANPEHEDIFVSFASQRAMKQLLRERIKTAMTGKKVTHPDIIKDIYNELYPNSIDIIMRGLEARKESPFVPIPADDPEAYFRKNMNRLLVLKMDQIFHKMEEVGRAKGGFASQYEKRGRARAENLTSDDKTEPEASNKSISEKDEIKTGTTQDAKDSVDKTEGSTEGAKTSNNTEFSKDVTMESENDKKEANQNEPGESQKSDIEKKEVRRYEDDIISTEKYVAYDKFLNAKVPHLLKKYSSHILKLLDVDNMYRKIEASIREETKKKLGATSKGESNVVKQEKPAPKTPLGPIPYFVKLMGKPNLPKRKAMESFFDQFKPRIIKKHRTVHNLLFVGFSDKASFDAILAANGTVIGRFTLDIMVSERNFKKEPNPEAEKDATDTQPTDTQASEVKESEITGTPIKEELNTSTSVNESLDQSSERLIGSDLDEQITDLLTTIKDSDGNESADNVGTENDGSEEAKAAEENVQDEENVEDVEKEEENKDLSPEIIKDMLTEIQGDTAQDKTPETNEANGTEEKEMNDATEASNVNEEVENKEETETKEEDVAKDTVSKLKPKAEAKPATPIRSSARLTRRTSTVQ